MPLDYAPVTSKAFRAAPPPAWHGPVRLLMGTLGGAAAGVDAITESYAPGMVSGRAVVLHVLLGALIGFLAVVALAWGTRRLVAKVDLNSDARLRYLRGDFWSYTLFLTPLLGALGVQFVGPLILLLVLGLIAWKVGRLYAAMELHRRKKVFSSLGWLAFLFLVSGFAALIYQIVWERVLFAAFGVNIESITIVVSLFMFGLGLGSLAGGLLARRFPQRAPELFLFCEVTIGCFGLVSIPLIEAVSRVTLYRSLPVVALTIFGLLVLPTMLMGATLPILVSHLYRHYRNLGKSVGILYCINTVGSAIACFITADVLFAMMGEQASVIVAAVCNFAVGVLVMRYARRIAREGAGSVPPEPLAAEPVLAVEQA